MFLGVVRAEDAQCSCALEHPAVEQFVLLPLIDVRSALFLDELPDRTTKR
jgi:hypothetical protein